jgi:hypothetical protein
LESPFYFPVVKWKADSERRDGVGDTATPSHREMPGVTIGFHKNPPAAAPEHEDEEETIARLEREKTAKDPVIQHLARRLGVLVHFLLDYRERATGQFGPRLDRLKN